MSIRRALTITAVALIAMAAIFALAAPALAAKPGPRVTGHPFLWDDVLLYDGTGRTAVVNAATSWTTGTVTFTTSDYPYSAISLLTDVDGDQSPNADATAHPEYREDGYMEQCKVWITPGLTGARLTKAVAAATGTCLGLTTPKGRDAKQSVMSPRSTATTPTTTDKARLDALYATNPVEPS